MQRTRGGVFGDRFDPSQVMTEHWGELQIKLDCDFGQLDYDSLPYGPGRHTLSRLTSTTLSSCDTPEPPNILLVIADDLGKDASAQYDFGDNLPNTPVLNSLADTGIVFDNCLLYTSPSPRDLSTSRMPSSA